MKLFPTVRPYWHVDAKWICGLFFIFFLAATLLLTTIVKLTDEKRGPKVAALAVGSLFVRGDSLGDVEEAKQELQKHGGVIYPLPNMPEITITEKDLTLSPAEIKLKVFLPLTTQLYNEGIEATAARYTTIPEQKDKFIKDASALRIFTKESHQALKSRLTALVMITVLLGLGVVYFSAGWGRLANPALHMLLASLLGTLMGLMITHPPKDGDGGGLGFLPRDVAQEIGGPLGQVYYRVTIFGIVLLVVALIGKLVSKLVKKQSSAKSTDIDSNKDKNKKTASKS